MKQPGCYRFLYCLAGLGLMLAWWPMAGFAADFLLKWNPNSAADQVQGYYVYYKAGASMAGDPANADQKAEIDLNASGFDPAHPSHTLVNLQGDTLYFFAVSAFSAAGEGALSDEVSLSKPSDNSDGEAPKVTAPDNIVLTAPDSSGLPSSDPAIAAFLSGATAMDDVDGPIAAITHDAPARFPLGTTTVTFSATDSAGYTGSAQAAVTVLAPESTAGDSNSGSSSDSGSGGSGCFIGSMALKR
jgi:Fibronectin type III domain